MSPIDCCPSRQTPYAWPCWSRAIPKPGRRSSRPRALLSTAARSSAPIKNVELSGGKIAKGIRVYDAMKQHRGANFGTATALSDEGWAVVEELAAEVAQAAKHQTKV